MPSLTDAEYQAGNRIAGPDVVDPSGNVVRSDNTTGTGGAPGQPTLPGSTDNTGGDQSLGSIYNYRQAARDALNEAAATRKGAQLSALSPYTKGLTNSDLSGVIGMINQGAGAVADTAFSSFIAAQNKALDLEQQNKNNALDLIKSIAANDAFGELPIGAITALSKNSGIDANALLGFQQSMSNKDPLVRAKALADINQTLSITPQAGTTTNQQPLTMEQALEYGRSGTLPSQAPNGNGLPPGKNTAASVGNPGGIRDPQTGQFKQFLNSDGSPNYQAGFQGVVDQLQGYMQGTGVAAKMGINSNSTVDQFVKSWIKGNPNFMGSMGYNGTDVANYLTNAIGINNVTPSTPMYQVGAENLAKAITHFESPGWEEAAKNVPNNTSAIEQIKSNPTITKLAQPAVVTMTSGQNKYLDMSRFSNSDPRTQAAIQTWANQNSIKPESNPTEIEGLQTINTSIKDLQTMSNTLNSLKNFTPANSLDRLYKTPIGQISKFAQVSSQLSAFNSLRAGMITILQGSGTIQGERIGTTILASAQDYLPDPTTDTIGTAQAKIQNFLKLISSKESSYFGQNNLKNASGGYQIPGATSTMLSQMNGGSTSGGTTLMTGPDGIQYNVPNNQVAAFKAAGGH